VGPRTKSLLWSRQQARALKVYRFQEIPETPRVLNSLSHIIWEHNVERARNASSECEKVRFNSSGRGQALVRLSISKK
jgi:hypothetical protein